MKITVLGSLGNIGKLLTQKLAESGHEVIGVDNRKEAAYLIKELGATPAIGDLGDVDFLTNSFYGADAVFTMYPPLNYLDPNLDIVDFYKKRSEIYAKAIKDATTVKRVVNLSSMGAHLNQGNGAIKGVFYVEKILNEIPSEISITHLRPNSLYTNLYGYIKDIKSENTIYASYGSKSIPWTSPKDIAEVALEEFTQIHQTRNIRYIASEELTGSEVAQIIGNVIGVPALKWKIISEQEMMDKLKAAGMNNPVAKELTEMYAALNSGLMTEDYMKNKIELGKTKLADFAKEFAIIYSQSTF
ncbi:NmrA family NAD(P)-binding protein [Olivibacter sp. SDN3]|uniref:NmrA family NAD(P)-binding protein n=1 Tax=Olivibacter sp. SDN3 TaxID=2764720 RepID=UPI0016511E7E|nr:NmrA family NAD(P)-binding protein [Olivibacter sp. SDN3]QNL47889.1 NmrA family NAD(P)-binding protein [Olivibacter sp. SDN3]